MVALTVQSGGGPASAAGAANGRSAQESSAATLYAHDADGRVTAVFNGSGAGSKIGYDPAGNITAVTAMPASTLAVAQVSPQSAAAGATVTIYGTDFGSSPSVTIGGATAAVQSSAANEIVATVPVGAAGSGVSVTAGGGHGHWLIRGYRRPGQADGHRAERAGGQPGQHADGDRVRLLRQRGQRRRFGERHQGRRHFGYLDVAAGGVAAAGGRWPADGDYPRRYRGLVRADRHAAARPKWTFTGTAGQNVYVQWSNACGCTTQLLGPDGTAVAFDEGSGAFLTAQLPSSGTYTLVMDVDQDPVTNTGPFTAQVSAIPADASATTTVGGTAGSVTISAPGQDADVTFSGTAGQQVFTQASFSPAPDGGGIAVFAPDGSLVGQATYDSGSQIAVDTITLPSTGTYKVKLSQLTQVDETTFDDIGYTGSASVTVTKAPTVTGTTTVDGTAGSLSLTAPGQHGVVTFTGTAGEKVFTKLTMSPAEASTGTVTLLQEPGGTTVGSNSMTGSSAFIDTVTLPASGSYEIVADPVDATGGYTGTITVGVNSAPDQSGTTSVNGTPASVALAKPGEQAVVSLAGTAGQEAFAQIALTGSPAQCGRADLQDTASGVVNFTSGCLNSPPVFIDDTTLPDTGTYQIVVTPSGGYTGTVTVTAVPAPATATGTYGGAAVKVTTTKPGQDAVITYTGVPADASTEVNVTASTFAADDEPSGYLNDPDGNAIAFCDDTVGVACTATSSVAGTYTLDLDHYGPFTGSTSAQLIAAPADGPAILHPDATAGPGPGLRAPAPPAPAPKVRAPRPA